MINLTITQQHDNTQTTQAVIDFYTAIFQSNEELATQMAAEDMTYIIHGSLQYDGKDGLKQMMKDTKESGATELQIDGIVTDNAHGAIKGVLSLGDGTQMQFCEFLTLTKSGDQVLVQRVESYAVAPAGDEG